MFSRNLDIPGYTVVSIFWRGSIVALANSRINDAWLVHFFQGISNINDSTYSLLLRPLWPYFLLNKAQNPTTHTQRDMYTHVSTHTAIIQCQWDGLSFSVLSVCGGDCLQLHLETAYLQNYNCHQTWPVAGPDQGQSRANCHMRETHLPLSSSEQLESSFSSLRSVSGTLQGFPSL